MMQYAIEILKHNNDTLPDYSLLEEKLDYGFSGGKMKMTSLSNYERIQRVLVNLAKSLAKNYSANDIAIIFFASHHNGKVNPLLTNLLDKIECEFGIRSYDSRSVKGIEFKAGIIVGTDECFKSYKKYLDEGIKSRNVVRFCEATIRILRQERAARNSLFSILRFITEVAFVYSERKYKKAAKISIDKKYKDIESKYPGILKFYRNDGLEFDEMKIYIRIVWNMIRRNSWDLSRYLYCLESYFIKGHSWEEDSLFGDLYVFINGLEWVIEESNLRRAGIIPKIDSSFIDINQFYVAITRFREEMYILYNKEFSLKFLLPGVEDYTDDDVIQNISVLS